MNYWPVNQRELGIVFAFSSLSQMQAQLGEQRGREREREVQAFNFDSVQNSSHARATMRSVSRDGSESGSTSQLAQWDGQTVHPSFYPIEGARLPLSSSLLSALSLITCPKEVEKSGVHRCLPLMLFFPWSQELLSPHPHFYPRHLKHS